MCLLKYGLGYSRFMDYWYKQTAEKPLFPDMLWSRPQNRATAGKLLIIGGSSHGFAAPAEAYAASVKAGIGVAKVLLPDATKKIVGAILENGEFAPSTPSGSFGKTALAELLDHAGWADGVLLAGDFGRNSETAILLEQFLDKYKGPATLTKDAVDYFKALPKLVFERGNTTALLSIAQLQKMCINLRFPSAVTLSMDLVKLVDLLHKLTLEYSVNLVVKQFDYILVASAGKVSSTKLAQDVPVWRVKTASHTSVWWLQNPTRHFESLSSAICSCYSKDFSG